MKGQLHPEESTVVFSTPHIWARFAGGGGSEPCTMAGKNEERAITLASRIAEYKATEVLRAGVFGPTCQHLTADHR